MVCLAKIDTFVSRSWGFAIMSKVSTFAIFETFHYHEIYFIELVRDNDIKLIIRIFGRGCSASSREIAERLFSEFEEGLGAIAVVITMFEEFRIDRPLSCELIYDFRIL